MTENLLISKVQDLASKKMSACSSIEELNALLVSMIAYLKNSELLTDAGLLFALRAIKSLHQSYISDLKKGQRKAEEQAFLEGFNAL